MCRARATGIQILLSCYAVLKPQGQHFGLDSGSLLRIANQRGWRLGWARWGTALWVMLQEAAGPSQQDNRRVCPVLYPAPPCPEGCRRHELTAETCQTEPAGRGCSQLHADICQRFPALLSRCFSAERSPCASQHPGLPLGQRHPHLHPHPHCSPHPNPHQHPDT